MVMPAAAQIATSAAHRQEALLRAPQCWSRNHTDGHM